MNKPNTTKSAACGSARSNFAQSILEKARLARAFLLAVYANFGGIAQWKAPAWDQARVARSGSDDQTLLSAVGLIGVSLIGRLVFKLLAGGVEEQVACAAGIG